ncbi:hypothetical protein QVD17_02400 [Tagetes erecta]|uniref:Cytochrome P450 n=1 Tax=Tagetes erecta TaxID=13708 RepID=A0AAD8L954_TARER|nr:hypothetical protein QVD17_02400 [Tagetes erecta]
MEILSIHRLNEFHDIRVEEIRLLVHKLLSMPSPVPLKSVFYELTLNVIMRMISGKRYFGGVNQEMEAEGKVFREILDETFILASASNGLIEQLRKSKETKAVNDRKTMIELLLSLQKSEPEYYTDAMIQSFVMVLLTGGSDTSAGTMEWIMSLLLNHPQQLKKAQVEIDRVVGNNRMKELSRRGEGLAVRMIGMTLGSIIQCFNWERISHDLVDMTEGPGIVMPKAVPLVAKCKPRLEMMNLMSRSDSQLRGVLNTSC